ncbi:unnamed protein product [Rhizophagus irregularis]|nr:unnamed protein product [Rhizophagus irregularis]CAB4409755.1 unnamed protein product [Rhizophagus irregularis]CAB4410474.1 unnamed protein product [Rhizophagus irregularis]CAB5317964.1 unnamed protein product [Rhizophagus irregularis]
MSNIIVQPADFYPIIKFGCAAGKSLNPIKNLTMASEKLLSEQVTKQTLPSQASQNSLAKASTIPSELILQIFKYVTSTADLKSCILVCKSWCRCGVELLWHKPVFTGYGSLIKLLVTLSRSTQTFPYALLIRRLNFSFLGEHVSDEILKRLSSCERLERLTLGGCRRLTDNGLLKLLDKADGLVALDVSDIENLTDAVVELVGERCRRLQGLNVSLCKKVSDKGILAVASKCRSLRRIKLSSCDIITDESVVILAKNCPHLLELDLTNCNQITNDAIQPVFENCTQLRELRLACCTKLTDESFTETMPALYEQLRILDLTSCALITDQTLLKIAHSAPKLRNLVLAKCGHCSRITDHSITHLARHCTRLRYLDLACCTQLTDASVFELSHLPKLRRIGLVKCALITDQAIYALIENRVVQHTLERVHLSYCVNLTVPAVLELVNSCFRLTHLSLTGVPAFLRPEVQQFCRQAPKEFTPHQRQVFCVFSGKGVKDLKQYLNSTVIAQQRNRIANGVGNINDQVVGPVAAVSADIEESVVSEAEGVGGDISEGGEGENENRHSQNDNRNRNRVSDRNPEGEDGDVGNALLDF